MVIALTRLSACCNRTPYRRWLFIALVIAAQNAVACRAALADGGTLQGSRRTGPWQVSLFTSPSPATVGPLDVSVLVQHGDTNETVSDATIQIMAREMSTGFEVTMRTTHEAATNKLLQAAWVDLPTAGKWVVTTQVSHGEENAQATFDLSISPAPPPWSDLALWIGWPFAAIGVFACVQIGASRRRQSRQ